MNSTMLRRIRNPGMLLKRNTLFFLFKKKNSHFLLEVRIEFYNTNDKNKTIKHFSRISCTQSFSRKTILSENRTIALTILPVSSCSLREGEYALLICRKISRSLEHKPLSAGCPWNYPHLSTVKTVTVLAFL